MVLNKCCLCLHCSEDLLEILGDNDDAETNICQIIKEHFWFIAEMYENDFTLKRICLSCWDKTKSFHEFYINVKLIQDNFVCEQQPIRIVTVDSADQLESQNIEDFSEVIKLEQQEISIENNVVITDNLQVSEDELPLVKIVKKQKKNKKQPTRQSKRRKTIQEKCTEQSEEIPEINVNNYADYNETCISEEDNNDLIFEEKTEENENDNDEEYIAKSKAYDDEQIRQFFNMSCDLCESEQFQTFRDVKAHYLSQHEIAKGYVICCKRKFKTLATIKEHMLWHANPDSFTCKLCKKVFVNKIGLSYHMLNHEPESNRPHKCDICDKAFAKFYQMNQHKVSHSYSGMDKKYKCETCGNGYPTPSHLRTHTRVVHDAIYAHVCDICAKVFKSKLVFDRHHNEMHLGIKPLKIQCQLCGAWLKNETYLRRHMVRHEEASKEFICKFCGKKSPSREALRSHERYVHISERKFKCSYCEKAFRKPKELREHSTMHTGEELYKCLFCIRTFNSNANMYSHQSKVHRLEWIEYKTRKNI